VHKSNTYEDEFMEMLRQNERIIYKVSSFYAGDEHPLTDLYQEVVISLWKAYPNFRGESKVSTWIYRIALNTCVTFFRKSRNKPAQVDIMPEIPDVPDNNEDIKTLYKLIAQLGKMERALVLLYLDEKPYWEIAEITGLSPTNVGTKLSRIKEKLKKMSNR
jgi:RNA polymerase sigma-70 factor (ECF subfamily)